MRQNANSSSPIIPGTIKPKARKAEDSAWHGCKRGLGDLHRFMFLCGLFFFIRRPQRQQAEVGLWVKKVSRKGWAIEFKISRDL